MIIYSVAIALIKVSYVDSMYDIDVDFFKKTTNVSFTIFLQHKGDEDLTYAFKI